MTSDLVTYYGQTDLIEQLVNNYGSCLEKLNREIKLLLRVTKQGERGKGKGERERN